MSADNGHYVCEFPTVTGGKEWRVIENGSASFMDELLGGEWFLGYQFADAVRAEFGDRPVHATEADALLVAFEAEKESYSEYGVTHLVFPVPFGEPWNGLR